MHWIQDYLGPETLLNISLYAELPSFNEVLSSVSAKSREHVQEYIKKLSGYWNHFRHLYWVAVWFGFSQHCFRLFLDTARENGRKWFFLKGCMMKKMFLLFIFLNIVSVNSFSATIPKGGVCLFAESDSGGGTAQPLDMPLRCLLLIFWIYPKWWQIFMRKTPANCNKYYVYRILFRQVPAQRLPEITDDNFDFSEHYLHYDTALPMQLGEWR